MKQLEEEKMKKAEDEKLEGERMKKKAEVEEYETSFTPTHSLKIGDIRTAV